MDLREFFNKKYLIRRSVQRICYKNLRVIFDTAEVEFERELFLTRSIYIGFQFLHFTFCIKKSTVINGINLALRAYNCHLSLVCTQLFRKKFNPNLKFAGEFWGKCKIRRRISKIVSDIIRRRISDLGLIFS